MALSSRQQTIHTDGAWDELGKQKGSCGFAFFSASLGLWVASGCVLGRMPLTIECELVGIIGALQHCPDMDMDIEDRVEQLEIKTDSTEAWGRIDRARDGYPLWPGAISTRLIDKTLAETLEYGAPRCGCELLACHAGSKGNNLADAMAWQAKDPSRSYGYSFLAGQATGRSVLAVDLRRRQRRRRFQLRRADVPA